jgi:hypothetical protein
LEFTPDTSRVPGKVDLREARSAVVHQELLKIRFVKGTAAFDSAPRSCVRKTFMGIAGDVCGFRDYDSIVSLSDPVFSGDTATLHLSGWNNPPEPIYVLAAEVMLYRLVRLGDAWNIVSRHRLQGH